MQPQVMAGLGGFFALVYLACVIGIIICLIRLLYRFVGAHVVGCGRGYYVKQTERFAVQARSAVNPALLQEWATNLIAKTPIENGATWVNLDVTGIPKCVVGLSDSLPIVSVTRSPESGDAFVVVQLHYGVHATGPARGFLVGDKSFKVKTENDQLIYGDQWMHVVPWQPGIYIWGEL